MDGMIVNGDLRSAVNTAIARRGITATARHLAPEPAPEPRYSEITLTFEEKVAWLADEGINHLRQQATGEFDPDRLPALHEYTAEWAQQHLDDRTAAPTLVLMGPPGCGKTSQSFAVVRHLILAYARRGEQLLWRFVTHRGFAAAVQRGAEEDADRVLARYATVPDLLIFSDLGDFNDRDFGRAVDFTSRLINHRWANQLPTIYETNLLYV